MANHINKLLKSILLVACLFPLSNYGQGIVIQSGGNLVLNSTANLVLNNTGITNDGSFTAGSSTVTFTGNTATVNSFIAGTAATDFYNLTVNKSSNGILLSRNIGVSNNLTLTSGTLYLNTKILDLGASGAIVGEDENNRITGFSGGYVQSTQTLNAPSAANPGNMGLEITSAANLGSTVVRRGHIIQAGGSIERYYEVIPTNNSGLDATIKFTYLDNELNGNDESILMVYTSTNSGVYWTFRGMNTSDMTSNYVTKSGLDRLDQITLAQLGAVLPLQLLDFNAKAVNRETVLNWTFAYESNVDRFEVERSADGVNFTMINAVKSQGKVGTTNSYESIDKSPLNGINYYRLKVKDVSGNFIYSKTVMVKLNFASVQGLSVYPNPAREVITVVLSSDKNEKYRMDLYNENGGTISTRYVNVVAGQNNIPWDISVLPAGIYNIRVVGSNSRVIKFLKQ